MTTDRRLPLHLAVLVGASTAAYAISLAGVTALQSAADGAVVQARTPARDAAARLTDGHDRLQAELDAAARAYATSAARYDALSAEVTTLDATLEGYADAAARVSGAARALPGRVNLPSVSRTSTGTTTKPRVSGTTGASG
jgi:hypothetical protein